MIPLIPEHAQYGKLEELHFCWFRQAIGQIAEEDKPRVVQGDGQAYFGAVNDMSGCRWGLRLDKGLSFYEDKYGTAEKILTTTRGSPRYILFQNHKLELGWKPTYQLRDMGATHLPYEIDPNLKCLGTFKNGNPCTRESRENSFYCGVCING